MFKQQQRKEKMKTAQQLYFLSFHASV